MHFFETANYKKFFRFILHFPWKTIFDILQSYKHFICRIPYVLYVTYELIQKHIVIHVHNKTINSRKAAELLIFRLGFSQLYTNYEVSICQLYFVDFEKYCVRHGTYNYMLNWKNSWHARGSKQSWFRAYFKKMNYILELRHIRRKIFNKSLFNFPIMNRCFLKKIVSNPTAF